MGESCGKENQRLVSILTVKLQCLEHRWLIYRILFEIVLESLVFGLPLFNSAHPICKLITIDQILLTECFIVITRNVLNHFVVTFLVITAPDNSGDTDAYGFFFFFFFFFVFVFFFFVFFFVLFFFLFFFLFCFVFLLLFFCTPI